MSIFSRARQRIRDLIGNTNRGQTQVINTFSLLTVDARQTDYAYWDRARRGAVRGLETSGLFLKPLGSKIAAWVLVPAPSWKTDSEQTQDELNKWWRMRHSRILRAYEEAIDLGDSYLVINSDLTVTIVPPHVVKPIHDKRDPAIIIGWIIREVYPLFESFENVVVTDTYTLTKRTRKVEKNGRVIKNESFPNRIGRLPIVHIGNYVGSDELYGRPEGEALINTLQRYGEVMEAAVKGNVRQGRPTPVIQRMGSNETVDRFWERHAHTETRTMPDGSTRTIDVIDFDPDQLLTLSGEADFQYAAPGSFLQDTEMLLGLLFYLILQHTEVPEFAWGNAISSSKASAESQLEPFLKWLGKKRAMAAEWLTEISSVALAYIEILNPAFPESNEDPVIQWPAITQQDAKTVLASVEWAYKNGLLDKVDALSLLPLSISEPKDAVQRAEDEIKFLAQNPLVTAPEEASTEDDLSGSNQDQDASTDTDTDSG